MLQQSILSKRLPQALLLSGSQGRGAVALAVEYAKTLNCLSAVTTNDSIASCNACQSCLQARTLQHPNITIVTALPPGRIEQMSDYKDDVIEEIKDQLAEISKDPYTPFRIGSANVIRIWQIRELNKSLSLSTLQQGRRIVIIIDAELMNTEATNAFLKTLEEPHDGVTIILTSWRPERLLPTIVSRCQELIIPPIADDEIVGELLRRGESTESEARIIAACCDGDMTVALEFIHEDVQEIRNDVITMFRSILRGRDFRLGIAESASLVAEHRDKARALTYLRFMQVWLRDARMLHITQSTMGVSNQDALDTLSKFAVAFGNANVDSALLSIDKASYDILQNVSINLTFTSLLMDLRTILAKGAASNRPSAA